MKTEKNSFGKAFLSKKRFVLIGLALCAMLLVSPALASDAGTLEIYGNANEDDTIDMRDLTYVKLIFFGKKPETELADAKYDGKINPLDFIQIKLIIVGKEKELTVVDSADRIVTAKEPIERIVVFNHGMFVTMRSIKATDKVVGVCERLVSHYGAVFPDVGDYPTAGWFREPDYEAVLRLNPDAVFLGGKDLIFGGNEEIIEKFKQIDPSIAVICFDCDNPSYYVEEVRKSGYLFGKREEAEEFIEFYEKYTNVIEEGVAKILEEDKPKVYFELPHKQYQTVGAGTPCHNMIVYAGGDNIFSDLSGSIDIDPEEVIKRNPEIIVKGGKSPGYNLDDPTILKKTRDKIMKRSGLTDVAAVKNESVYIFPYGFVCTPTHFICTAYLAKWFHPKLFKDLDPKAIHQEYITRFLEVEYGLDKHGVFVYPEVN
ncbi:MAG: ABC transporter substrate-binding protein [Euryarchaeota archaeon]|nr:ABC transporter substrate-binding protein [Euryarchaeota archaeon]